MGDSSDYFRNKVWYIINTIQANQLFVHSANLKVRYSEEEMLFLDKKELKSKKKSSKKKKKKTNHQKPSRNSHSLCFKYVST